MIEDILFAAVISASAIAGMYLGDWHSDGGSIDDFIRLDIIHRSKWILKDMAGVR